MLLPKTLLDENALVEIQIRANAATKGPWHQSALAGMYIVAGGVDYATVASVGEYNADGSIHLAFADAETNLDFIAHAREDIPALCATVKHLRELAYLPKILPDDDDTTFQEQGARLLREKLDLQSQLEQLRAELSEAQSLIKMAQTLETGLRAENERLLTKVTKQGRELV